MTKFAVGSLVLGWAAWTVEAGFKDIEQALFRRLNESSTPREDTAGLRGAGLSAYFRHKIDDVINSGCWCYFDEDHYRAKGKPVNSVDSYCKTLHNGYQCIIMDIGPSCVPWAVDYVQSSGVGTHEQILEACQFNNNENNGNNCMAYSCAVENFFVNNIYNYMNSGFDFDTSVRHDSGTFEPQIDCPTGQQNSWSEKQCCAQYPSRYPYRTLNGDRGCCNDKTFDTNVYGCCDDAKTLSVNCRNP